MFNTNLRTKARNDFQKDIYKSMNTSIYANTMDQARNRINFRFILTEKEALASNENFKRFTIFIEDLEGLHTQKN